MTTIDYYFTLNSPWTYLGSARFAEIAKRHGATVNVKPAKFGVIFPQTGGLPLTKRAPARQKYRLMEIKRWPEHLGIPFISQPKNFPSDETKGTRLVLAAAQAGQDAHALATEIGRALWERDENFGEDSVLDAAAERAGLNAAELRTVASDEELDARHDAFTAEALERGVFGAPSYVLQSGEFFWGQDRLEFLDRALAS